MLLHLAFPGLHNCSVRICTGNYTLWLHPHVTHASNLIACTICQIIVLLLSYRSSPLFETPPITRNKTTPTKRCSAWHTGDCNGHHLTHLSILANFFASRLSFPPNLFARALILCMKRATIQHLVTSTVTWPTSLSLSFVGLVGAASSGWVGLESDFAAELRLPWQ